MNQVIGYTYAADTYCIPCTAINVRDGVLYSDLRHPYAVVGDDDNGLPLSLVDTEGNIIHAMFSTDDVPPTGEWCGGCHECIVKPWDSATDDALAGYGVDRETYTALARKQAGALTFEQVKSEWRIAATGDDWGDAMSAWFVIADEIYFNRSRLDVPDEWRFRPSPLGESNDPDDFVVGVVRLADDDVLMRFGQLMNRYCRLLKHLGKDY